MIPSIPRRQERAQFYAGLYKLDRMSREATDKNIVAIYRYAIMLLRMSWSPEQSMAISMLTFEARSAAKNKEGQR